MQLTIFRPERDERRAFIRAETTRLGAFLDVDAKELVGWSRSYRCGCGFRCTTPGDIWDHSLTCRAAPADEGKGAGRG